jgi:hypothetical protein
MYITSNYNHFLPHQIHCSLAILPPNKKLLQIYVVKLTTNKINNTTNLILWYTSFHHNTGYFLHNSLNISEAVWGVTYHWLCPYSLLIRMKQPVKINKPNMDMYKIFYAIHVPITSSALLLHYSNSTYIWSSKPNTEFLIQTQVFPDVIWPLTVRYWRI